MRSYRFTQLFLNSILVLSLTLAGLLSRAEVVRAAGTVSLTTLGSAYSENFDTLANSDTSSTVPNGWDFIESGTNANTTYTAGTGSSNAGDTYSFGALTSMERAFGCLLSGSLVPTVGASFTNNTDSMITDLEISYTGEQWRLGATGRTDRLDFQLSTDATSLTTGTWTDLDSLDFSSPVATGTVGALDGNAVANRTLINQTISGLSIPDGSTFWIRWTDFNASGADDGLAVDDFSLTPLFDVTQTDPLINEFVFNHTGTDTNEYVEIFGDFNSDYSAYTILQIEGDDTGAGLIDSVHLVETTDANGFWRTGFLSNVYENGTVTLLLVESFTGAQGDDLDTDNDGLLDSTPWSRVVDDVAVSDGGASDRAYSSTVLSSGFDGVSFVPGGASRIPNGTDTDSVTDWTRNDFDGAGLPGFTGTLDEGEALNTPGAENALVLVAPELVINEIDYDQPGTDTAEFIEIKNNGSSDANLDNVTLELVNGTGGGAALYQTIDFPAVTLAAGDYFVVCGDAANVLNCDLDLTPDTNLIQNGAPDAVGLRFEGQLIDTVSYEGDSGAPYTEGSGLGLVDDAVGVNSISRCPDGQDTNQNNVDFIVAFSTPGEANACDDGGLEIGMCGDPATFIHEVQGSGLTSPLVGMPVVIEGIVVGDFQNNSQPDNGDLDGFYVQEEGGDTDVDSTTSEGIFVFGPNAADVSIGNQVRVLGDVAEFSTSGGASVMTELSNVDDLIVCEPSTSLPAPTPVTLPVTSLGDFERYEGMLVTFPQALTISEFFNFDRFNEVVLTVDRQHQPTAVEEPGSPRAAAIAQANLLSRITLDDGRSTQNPDPAIHPNGNVFDLSNRFRGGDTVQDATGVIDHTFGLYRIHPTEGADYSSQNPRPEEPEDVGGSLKVASFNVLNYFTTLDDGVNDICGPLENQECRGADTPEEFERQRDKIIAALAAMDVDVVGLIEIENHPGDVPTADLVSGLNDALGGEIYDYIATGAIGTDAIRQAIIYKPASVTPVGPYAILDSSVDPRFLDDFNRPVLAQTFEENSTGRNFTVAVNHLKSKGSDCNVIGDPDTGDGQGNCNLTRKAAAEALVDWLATDPTGSGDADFLIIGDLNSYDKEDPIDVLLAGADDNPGTIDDYTDLIFQYQGEFAYSYLFDGQLGYLDHALANRTMAAQVTGATVWHINADEPDILDYDMTFKQDAQDALFESNAYRSSDHDPVVIGLSLFYDWDGFFPPVANPPALNEANAGSSIPVRFSLDGDQGLEIFAEGYPLSTPIDCSTGAEVGPAEGTVPAGNSGLTYDPLTDEYIYVWKTEKSWADTCRRLIVTLDDGSVHTADFQFKK